MDVQVFENLLSVLSAVGTERVKLTPTEDGDETLVSASGTNNNVIIFDTIDDVFSEHTINIQNINALLSRLRLFDLSKASVSFVDNNKGENTINTSITIKQGRRKVTYHLAYNLAVPKYMPDMEMDGEPIKLDKEYTDYLSSAVNAVSMTGDKAKRKVKMSCNDGDLKVTVSDGENDSFSDTVEVDDDVVQFETSQWNVPAFQKVMKQSVDKSEEGVAEFFVSEQGIAVFQLDTISVMVPPELD